MFDEVITKYSVALYEVALEKGDFMLDSVELVRGSFKNRDLVVALMHPELDEEEKHEIIDRVFAKDLPKELIHLLYVIADHKRSHLTSEILNAYEDLCYEGENIERVLVLTPFKLSEEKLEAIGAAYGRAQKSKVRLRQKLDPSLIGGVKLITDHGVIDRSIHRQLDELKRNLKHNA